MADRKPIKIHSSLTVTPRPRAQAFSFKPPELPPGVIPAADELKRLALDGKPFLAADSAELQPFFNYANRFSPGMGFPGYPYLSELTRVSEYRQPAETLAEEMTRKWVKLKSTGKADLSDKIKKIEQYMDEVKLREMFRRAATQVSFFGRTQIIPRIQGRLDDDSRANPFEIDSVDKGSLLGFQLIEPYWTTPYIYNTTDPTDPWFFKPIWWFVLGKKIHASWLMTLIGHELPDLFKPAYNFSGLSLSQLMQPAVQQWLRTRDAVSNIIFKFSTTVLKTNMEASLSGNATNEMQNRATLFTKFQNNDGLMMIDKDTEELEKVVTPLSTLDALQAQAQEHMAAPARMPLVKMTGITPSGLNASSEGEIQVWYDHVHAMQEILFKDPLERSLKIIQMHLYGSIDLDLGFEFVDLTELDGEAKARVRKSDADSGSQYIQLGVVTPAEERERLSSDPSSGYDNLSGPPPEPTPMMLPPTEGDDNSDDKDS